MGGMFREGLLTGIVVAVVTIFASTSAHAICRDLYPGDKSYPKWKRCCDDPGGGSWWTKSNGAREFNANGCSNWGVTRNPPHGYGTAKTPGGGSAGGGSSGTATSGGTASGSASTRRRGPYGCLWLSSRMRLKDCIEICDRFGRQCFTNVKWDGGRKLNSRGTCSYIEGRC
jgi:hypothetical protein